MTPTFPHEETESEEYMNSSEHGIEISGAGPSGLAAALTLARAGRRVTVFERRPEVGGRFHGDFQGLENWTTEGDVLEELSAIGIESSFDAAPFREGVFHDPDGREYRYSSDQPLFYLVRRGPGPGTVDDGLKRQALAAGVEIRFSESKDHLPNGGIVSQGPRGADVIAVGYVFETDASDVAFGALSERLAPKGYSYLLIHGGRGTVASCMFDDYHDEKVYLERTVEFYRKTAGLVMRNPRRFGGTGNFEVPATARQGRLLFAGEAAGFQDALWGFGMRYAMLSGHLAAQSLLENGGRDYDRRWNKRLGGLLRSAIVNRSAYDAMGDPGYRKLMKSLDRAPDARMWLHNHYAGSLWKRLFFPLARRRVRSRRKTTVCVREGCDCTWCRCAHATEEEK
ncbi:MAG: FAD-dependent oxidoreductase [Acidobacteriota bacterium]